MAAEAGEDPSADAWAQAYEPFDEDLIDDSAEHSEMLQQLPLRTPTSMTAPSQAEQDDHILRGHSVYAGWCVDCVSGHGREMPHQRQERESEVFKMILDYSFLDEEERRREDKTQAVKVAAMCGSDLPAMCATQVSQKGESVHAVAVFSDYLERLGHSVARIDKDQPSEACDKAEQAPLRVPS